MDEENLFYVTNITLVDADGELTTHTIVTTSHCTSCAMAEAMRHLEETLERSIERQEVCAISCFDEERALVAEPRIGSVIKETREALKGKSWH